MAETTPKQLLHLVFGGELKSLDTVEFKDLDKLDIVGVYPNYATAYAAWKAKAQQTVDNAHMRYFIVHCTACSIPRPTRRAAAVSGYAAPMLSWKRLGKQRWVQVTAGTLAAEYLRLVFKTTTLRDRAAGRLRADRR